MRIEHVFGDLRPFAQCHAASVLRRTDRGLFVTWFGGTVEGHQDTAIWAADRTPDTDSAAMPTPPTLPTGGSPGWNAPRQIAKVGDVAHWNPVLFAPREDLWVLHFKVGRRIREWATWSQTSRDAGRTWQDACVLVPGDVGGRGAVKNKCIRLTSGDWLAGASTESWRRWDAFVDRSASGLDDWRACPPLPIERRRLRGRGIIQPTLWESSPGHVHALLRSTEGVLFRSDSSDDGFHWSTARPTTIPNNNSGIDAVRMRNGMLALACNPVEGNWAARSPLSILFSGDNGESWTERLDIETEPGEFSYPALIEDGDGLCLAYTWNRRRIAVARLAESEIPKP
jgi:predicted neuraminidase